MAPLTSQIWVISASSSVVFGRQPSHHARSPGWMNVRDGASSNDVPDSACIGTRSAQPVHGRNDILSGGAR